MLKWFGNLEPAFNYKAVFRKKRKWVEYTLLFLEAMILFWGMELTD